MKERPILFSGPMVRAILDGRKTMTRRVIKAPRWSTPDKALVDFECPYGWIGDRLWVRETWAKLTPAWSENPVEVRYRADFVPAEFAEMVRWKSSRFMPRWASRITLEITGVRVERVQDITPDDCRAEGMPHDNNDAGVRYCFGQLWNTINSARGFGWDVNPWVWVVSFKRLT